MSLLGTLAKVAVGIAVAKGVGSMMKKSGGGGGGILGNAPSQPQQGGSGQGGLGDLLGQVLGGGQPQSGGRSGGTGGGLGDLLEQLGGGMRQGGRSGQGGQGGFAGGLGDILGQFTGGRSGGSDGGLGDLLGGLVGGASQKGSGGSFGEMLNDSLRRGGEPAGQPSAEQEAMAALMLRAMIQAVKCDGELDANERKKLLSNLDDATPQEMAFVEHELQQPVDVQGLARQVPRGLEQQVYTMSVMAIDLDKQAEAQYLHNLASALGIDQRQVNAIHDHIGVQRIYS